MKSILSRYTSLFIHKAVLEIGSGTGAQLQLLQRACRSAVGVEVSARHDTLAQVLRYDGTVIPFPDSSFDIIFSSHVMEHLQHEKQMHSEMHRVLRSDGVCVHVVPSAAWRWLAQALHYPGLLHKGFMKLSRSNRDADVHEGDSGGHGTAPARWRARLSYAFVPKRHGEFGTWFTEPFLFRREAWRRRFRSYGWKVLSAEAFGPAQSGHYMFGQRLSLDARQKMTRFIGAPSFLFVLAAR